MFGARGSIQPCRVGKLGLAEGGDHGQDVEANWHMGTMSRSDTCGKGPSSCPSRGPAVASPSRVRRQVPPRTLEVLTTRWTLVGQSKALGKNVADSGVRRCDIGFGESSVAGSEQQLSGLQEATRASCARCRPVFFFVEFVVRACSSCDRHSDV